MAKADPRHQIQYALISNISAAVKKTTTEKPMKEMKKRSFAIALLEVFSSVYKKERRKMIKLPKSPIIGIGIPKGYAYLLFLTISQPVSKQAIGEWVI